MVLLGTAGYKNPLFVYRICKNRQEVLEYGRQVMNEFRIVDYLLRYQMKRSLYEYN